MLDTTKEIKDYLVEVALNKLVINSAIVFAGKRAHFYTEGIIWLNVWFDHVNVFERPAQCQQIALEMYL